MVLARTERPSLHAGGPGDGAARFFIFIPSPVRHHQAGQLAMACVAAIPCVAGSQPSASGGGHKPRSPARDIDLQGPDAPAWFTLRGRPISPVSSVCYPRSGGGP
jgi:hypothetical protein